MRFVHPGEDDPRLMASSGKSEPGGDRNSPRHCRKFVPLDRLSAHRQGNPRGGGAHEWRKGGRRMTSEIESSQARTQKLEGLGTRRKRVEDIRFTQGKGNYVDDLKFPAMLFGGFVRSPYGHARVKS